jgi:hypothetical protein
MPFYFADDYTQPSISNPISTAVIRPFKLSVAKALLTTAASGFLINDVIYLAPIPGGVELVDYNIDMPSLDSGTTVTEGVGDDQVLAGAVTGAVSTTPQTTPSSLATSFTLTAAASTASFASTGLLNVNGVKITYGGISGSTFTTCYANQTGVVLPAGAVIAQCGNQAAYVTGSTVGQNGTGYLYPQASAAVHGSLPGNYNQPFQVAGVGSAGQVLNVGGNSILMRITASPTGNPSFTTAVITGYIAYVPKGPQW